METIFFCFDTNTLRGNDKSIESFDEFRINKFDKLLKFLTNNNLDNKITLLLPEVVILELEKQKNTTLNNWIKNIKNYSQNFKPFELFQKSLENIDVKKHLANLKEQKIKNIEVINIPNDKNRVFKDIFNRTIEKIAPFKSEKSDAGFKDCLIYLSLKEYAENYDENSFYFFTSDKGFTESKNKITLEKEFLSATNNKLIIVDSDDFQGYVKMLFKIDLEINNIVSSKIVPSLETYLETYSQININEISYPVTSTEINPEKTIQEDEGNQVKIIFIIDVEYNDLENNKHKTNIQKIYFINKKTKIVSQDVTEWF